MSIDNADVSRANLEVVRAFIPQLDADWSQLIRDAEGFALLHENLSPLLTDDFESVVIWPAVHRAYEGLEGLRKNWLDWLEPWATYRITIDELIDVGDRIVVLSRNYGRRKDMAAEVELIAAAILTFRGGKIARWEDYAERAAALKAAGLSQAVHPSR